MFIYRSIEDKLRQSYLQLQYIHNTKSDSALCGQMHSNSRSGSITGMRNRRSQVLAALVTRGAGSAAACTDTAGDWSCCITSGSSNESENKYTFRITECRTRKYRDSTTVIYDADDQYS